MTHLITTIVLWAAAAVFLLTAAVYDLKYRVIPNWLTLTAAIFAAAYWGYLSSWQAALANLGIGLGIGFALFLIGIFGAGDAKLLAALAALIGPSAMFMALAGAYCCLLLYVVPRRIRKLGLRGFTALERQGFLHLAYTRSLNVDDAPPEAERVPLGPFFLLGLLPAMFIR